uniref:G-protein coupled receptors family 1 profile domain-containing protein n=1 Tax=Panagrolaimus sp. JU765 TaxID=591449 RepID=A0AC34R018_9BILA
MVVFMCSEIVLDIAAFVYVGYLAIWWRGQSATYDAYWMFWTGFPDSVILILAPISVVFLGLDRCVSILTLNNHQKARSIIMTCATFLAMSIDLTVATILHVIPSWPTKSETTCRSFGCLGPNSAGQTYTTCRYVTILDSFPHLASFALYTFFNINITVYLGPYSLICSALESFSCSMIYRRTLHFALKHDNSIHTISSDAKGAHPRMFVHVH